MALQLAPADHGATGPAEQPATDDPLRPGPPVTPARVEPRRSGTWRSRCLATVAYLAALAGLLAVAMTGNDSDLRLPVTGGGERVAASGLAGVVLQITAGPVGAEQVAGPSQP